ncbi:hypothetical protein D3C86_1515820 [compost metagenome]
MQGEINQQFQFQDRQLTPSGVVVEFDADQRGDVGVVIQFTVFQTLDQCFEAGLVQAVQVQNVSAEKQGFIGVIPNQIVERIDLRIIRHQNAAGGGTDVFIHRHVRFLAHVFENAEQRRGFLGIGVFTLAGEVPLDEFVVGAGTEEAP